MADTCKFHGGAIKAEGGFFVCCFQEPEFGDPTPASDDDTKRAARRALIAAALPNASTQRLPR